MRHLRVPSAETQDWLALCRSSHWLVTTSGVVRLDGGFRGIPLVENAPDETDACWKGHLHVESEGKGKGPVHWTERLPEALQELPPETWPSAYEIQGDVLIVKLEGAAAVYGESIAEAMLEQLPNIRVICADEGVKGDFRVRDLDIIKTRDGTEHTRTRVREHGHFVWVDPAKAYFSTRLSSEREKTLTSVQNLRIRLDRPLVIADPYAGVGPAFPLLFAEPGLIEGCLAGDLNPDAVDLLRLNIEYWQSRRSDGPLNQVEAICADALQWSDTPSLLGQADVLLVNLPHNSLEHLPGLLPLLRRGEPVLIRGWAIREREHLADDTDNLQRLLHDHGAKDIVVDLAEIKGFSTSKCFVAFECNFTL